MNKIILLKKIVENPEFREKYWPDLKIDEKISDYSSYILRSKNPYLETLYNLIIDDKDTSNILYKKILKYFKL